MTSLTYIQIGLGVLLTITILMQQRGGGMSSGIFGGSSLGYSTKRGVEKLIFYASIIIAILFVLALLATVILPTGQTGLTGSEQ